MKVEETDTRETSPEHINAQTLNLDLSVFQVFIVL